MTATERYAALRSLYLHWFERTGDTLHLDLAEYCGNWIDGKAN